MSRSRSAEEEKQRAAKIRDEIDIVSYRRDMCLLSLRSVHKVCVRMYRRSSAHSTAIYSKVTVLRHELFIAS